MKQRTFHLCLHTSSPFIFSHFQSFWRKWYSTFTDTLHPSARKSPRLAQHWPEWVDVSLVNCSKSTSALPLVPWDLVFNPWCFYHHQASTFGLDFFPEAPIKIRSCHWRIQSIPEYIYSFIHWCKANLWMSDCRYCAGLWAQKPLTSPS